MTLEEAIIEAAYALKSQYYDTKILVDKDYVKDDFWDDELNRLKEAYNTIIKSYDFFHVLPLK